MYSRRFADTPDIPADYGGFAYRKEQAAETSDNPKGRGEAGCHKEREEHADHRRNDREEGREHEYTRAVARRPLYRKAADRTKERPIENDKSKGLLSSLFSLSGKSFSMEDIVLAGLLLLLISEGKEGRSVDNELLLIIGLLLLSK